MDYTEPRPLTDVIAKLDARTVIGSTMRSAEWEKLPQALRDRAVFSAGVESVRWLSALDQGIKDIVTRAKSVNEKGESYFTTDRAKIIADLRNLGKEIGIPHPDGPRKDGKINEHDLTDPLSIRRLKLIVDTQMEMAYGYANYVAANDPSVLEQWPCQELIRVAPRKVPRAWHQRWAEHGGQFYAGRMIARKDSPIWTAVSRFGNPYPPFDYQSGMGVADVDYDEAVSLGVIKDGENVTTQVPEFNAGLESSVKNLANKEQGWLKKLLGDNVQIEDGAAKWVETDASGPATKPLETPTKKSDDNPRVQTADNPTASPPIPPGLADGQTRGGEAPDAAAIREAVETVFRAALGESYPEIHSPNGGFQKGVEAHIAVASVGQKPLYFDPWGNDFGAVLAKGLDKVLPAAARIENVNDRLYVFTEAAARKIIEQKPDAYLNSDDVFEMIRESSDRGDNGYLLGYHTLNDRIRPAARVTLLDDHHRMFVQFYTKIESVETAAAERLRDLMLALPDMEFFATWEIVP